MLMKPNPPRYRNPSFRAERPVSPCMGSVSRVEPEKPTFGNRSLPARDRSLRPFSQNTRSGTGFSQPGTGCLKSCCSTALRGPVSPIRDRSPRVKTLRTKSKL
uniref:Uncharacterized protein n=1 Tax=Ananas comosus var. bracteatus TaxID=296719 RepID=A0A6V7QLZ9_ANACO|nr:unnamed protein product [Ananas comosus var. bracteatus]